MTENIERFWGQLYQENNTPWESEQGTCPYLSGILSKINNPNAIKQILLPGCGRALNLQFILKHFPQTHITCIDLVPETKQLSFDYHSKIISKKAWEQRITWESADYFSLKFNKLFDLVIERAFFCAIPTELARKYINTLNTKITLNGYYAGVYYLNNTIKTINSDEPPFKWPLDKWKVLLENQNFKNIELEDFNLEQAPATFGAIWKKIK